MIIRLLTARLQDYNTPVIARGDNPLAGVGEIMHRSPSAIARCCIGIVSVAGLYIFAASASLAVGPEQHLRKPDEWFKGAAARRLADNILSHQSDLGGWPKNIDTTARLYEGDRNKLQATFDNGATTGELRYLAHMHRATGELRYREAFDRGLKYILDAQYANGGWPQFVPPPKGTYHRYITFNDDAMVRLLEFVRDCSTSDLFKFLPEDRRRTARDAFGRGIECILKCQVRVAGKLTVWCAQHDEVDYRPRPARSFELASLSGAESVGIVRLLMTIEHPGSELVEAVEAAVQWFDSARITGVREVKRDDSKAPKGSDKVVVKDPNAPPLWARFYEIETNRPLFADRDGVGRYDLSEIGYERRNGYAWYGNWPQRLLERDYPAWKQARANERR
jgi:pectate lyase